MNKTTDITRIMSETLEWCDALAATKEKEDKQQ